MLILRLSRRLFALLTTPVIPGVPAQPGEDWPGFDVALFEVWATLRAKLVEEARRNSAEAVLFLTDNEAVCLMAIADVVLSGEDDIDEADFDEIMAAVSTQRMTGGGPE
jgi:hypothetical protein